MAQWEKYLGNNIFASLLPLPLLCEISGAYTNAISSYGRLAGRQTKYK